MWGPSLLLEGVRGALDHDDEESATEGLKLFSLLEEASPSTRGSAALLWARLGDETAWRAALAGGDSDWTRRDPERTCEAMRDLSASASGGYPALAKAALDTCLHVRDDAEILKIRADLAIAEGDVASAHALLQRLVAADPEALEPTLKLVELLAVYMRREDEARRLLDVAAARHPHAPRIGEVRSIVNGTQAQRRP